MRFRTIKQLLLKLAVVMVIAAPSVVSAGSDTDGPFNASDFANGFGINNTATPVSVIALAILEVMLELIGVGTIMLMVYYGIMMASSQGDAQKVEQAKKSLIWAVVGIIVIGASLYLISASKNAVTGVGI